MLTEQLEIKEQRKHIDKNVSHKNINRKDIRDRVYSIMKKNIDMFIRLRDK